MQAVIKAREAGLEGGLEGIGKKRIKETDKKAGKSKEKNGSPAKQKNTTNQIPRLRTGLILQISSVILVSIQH